MGMREIGARPAGPGRRRDPASGPACRSCAAGRPDWQSAG